jgi:hypothetical protein
MYHKGVVRHLGVKKTWAAVESAAQNKTAVVTHCNQSFHRGPVLTATLLILGGDTKEEAFRKIAAARTIYAGHTKDWDVWPESEKSNRHAGKLWEAHEFAGKVAAGLVASLRPLERVAASSGLQPEARCQVPTKSTKSTKGWGTGSNQSLIDLTRDTTKSSAPADPAYPPLSPLQESTAKRNRRLGSDAEKMLGEPKPTMNT